MLSAETAESGVWLRVASEYGVRTVSARLAGARPGRNRRLAHRQNPRELERPSTRLSGHDLHHHTKEVRTGRVVQGPMLSSLFTGAVTGTAVAALVTVSVVRTARPLEAKLAAMQRLLIIVGLACVVCAIAMLSSDPLPPSMSSDTTTDPATQIASFPWRIAVSKEVRDLRATISTLLFGTAWLTIPLVLVLSSLRTFVLEHRLDLATRMQIAAKDEGGKKA